VATLERRSIRWDKDVVDLFDMELPIGIKVSGEIDGSELGRWPLAIGSVQRMPDRSIRSLIRFLHAPSTGPLGDRPSAGEVLVIAHAGAVAVKVTGDSSNVCAWRRTGRVW